MSGSCSNLSGGADSYGFQNPKFQNKNLWMGSVMATHTIVKLFGEKKTWYFVWWKKTWYIMIFNLCLSSSSCLSPASWGTSSDKHGLMIVLMFCVPRLWCSILRSLWLLAGSFCGPNCRTKGHPHNRPAGAKAHVGHAILQKEAHVTWRCRHPKFLMEPGQNSSKISQTPPTSWKKNNEIHSSTRMVAKFIG